MNQLYFCFASILFLLAGHACGLAADAMEKQDRMMPAHLQRAFEAGCYTKSKLGCKDAALQFRKEQDRIYN